MKWSIDGDQVCITKDDFVNLQESPAVFYPVDSDIGRTVIRDGIKGLAIYDLQFIKRFLDEQESDMAQPTTREDIQIHKPNVGEAIDLAIEGLLVDEGVIKHAYLRRVLVALGVDWNRLKNHLRDVGLETKGH